MALPVLSTNAIPSGAPCKPFIDTKTVPKPLDWFGIMPDKVPVGV
jgi:hypothetical protein